MIRNPRTLALALTLSLWMLPGHAQLPPVPAPLQIPAPNFKAETTTRQLAKGVMLIQEIIPSGAPGGPQIINVLKIDPKEKSVRVEAALGYDRVWEDNRTQGREIVSTLSARRKAVAAINAGFFTFESGHPLGLHIENGELVTEPGFNRTVFALGGKSGLTATLGCSALVRNVEPDGGTAFPITGLNRKPGKGNELLLFTPKFFSNTLPAPGRFEVVLEGIDKPLVAGKDVTGKVQVTSTDGRTPFAPGTVVLSASGKAADWLRTEATPGRKMTLHLDMQTVDGKKLPVEDWKQAIAGGPRLVTEGKVTVMGKEEGMSAGFTEQRHPRTAAGVTADGTLLFVTIDGRQPGLSRGASLAETAEVLLKYGAVEAVNLDGGGSTTLAIRDGVANAPSGNIQRAVANAFLVYGDAETKAEKMTLVAPPKPLVVGETWTFTTPTKGKSVERTAWGTNGGIGFVTQTGVFVARRAGVGTVRVFCGESLATVRVQVIAPPIPKPTPTPIPTPVAPRL